MDHSQHAHHHHGAVESGRTPVSWAMAAIATLHCLTGCAIGEVLGLVIGTALGWGTAPTIALAVGLAFAFGYALTMRPLLASGLPVRQAVRTALAALGPIPVHMASLSATGINFTLVIDDDQVEPVPRGEAGVTGRAVASVREVVQLLRGGAHEHRPLEAVHDVIHYRYSPVPVVLCRAAATAWTSRSRSST